MADKPQHSPAYMQRLYRYNKLMRKAYLTREELAERQQLDQQLTDADLALLDQIAVHPDPWPLVAEISDWEAVTRLAGAGTEVYEP